jgi:hypothetical protein
LVYVIGLAMFGIFQCSIVIDQPVNARNDPNVADSEKENNAKKEDRTGWVLMNKKKGKKGGWITGENRD